jgi:4-hydroxy 2-oxovalerate aldolase
MKILKESGKKLGMHLHDHSGMAILNYSKLTELGFESSDTSIRGMGKGSGNLKLEYVVNKKSLIDVADFINENNNTLTINPTPYELITAMHSLTDNYAKEAYTRNISLRLFNEFCKTVSGLDRDTYNEKLINDYGW